MSKLLSGSEASSLSSVGVVVVEETVMMLKPVIEEQYEKPVYPGWTVSLGQLLPFK